MVNVIAIVVLVLIVAGAGAYVYKAKKSGQKCVGCPHSKQCSACASGCGCKTK